MSELWEVAKDIAGREHFDTTPQYLILARDIHQALVAERERCVKIAEAAYDSPNFADRSPRHIAQAIRKG